MNRRFGNENPGQMLLTAVLFTLATLIWIYMAIQAKANAASYSSFTLNCISAIILAGGIISIVYWKRWFDTRKKK